MAHQNVSVKITHGKGNEEAYFAERDQKILRDLREKTARESNDKYRKEHEYHCFRCGTPSLAEIDEGHVKIDICVNENCGAIHLDPGELKELIANSQALPSARKAFLGIFKK